jgi:alginate O-acetyltransferase complex protein AlgI
MVFSSLVFLFLFLPLVLISYHLLPHGLRNFHLLLVSLFFYAWGEGVYTALMVFSITANYFIGRTLAARSDASRKLLLALGIVVNLLPLLYFKYSPFFLNNLSAILPATSGETPWSVHLPIGISFFTFQSISYLVDVYRGTIAPQTSFLRLGLFISLFPQLIAGPIVRYKDIFFQLGKRQVTLAGFSHGVERFVLGLGKKVLLANPLGQIADAVFALPPQELSTAAVWIGATSYMLQIYFDFSGYSDMAIGLGRMFGFTFLENFNFPYIAKSIQEFWRRWHISLSNWFRDYLYIPLGGNRKGARTTAINLFIVFAICGLWHGASWTFLVWGLFHGFFLALERGRLGHLLKKTPPFLCLCYTLFIVLIGWVIFRADSLEYAGRFIAIMFGFSTTEILAYKVFTQLTPHIYTVYAFAILCCTPLLSRMYFPRSSENSPPLTIHSAAAGLGKTVLLGMIFVLSVSSLATGAYNPFIYFRF